MITAFELAGFFAAHAVWCVSDGETLTPMLAYTSADDERRMERLVVGEDLAASVALGEERLEANRMDASDAALLYDGRISIGAEKLDAILIEVRAYFSPWSEAMLAVPYSPKSSGRFRVHRPKLLAWENSEDFDLDLALEKFFEDVEHHEKGAEIWNAYLDESR
jgi:hypothetical protein